MTEKRADRRAVPLLPPGAPLWFPPVEGARRSGLLAAGGDLSPERLLFAYRQGIFPWYDAGTPILWWTPDPRCVLFPEELHIPRSLAKLLRSGRFTITLNRAFDAVIRQCAAVPRPGQHGTWLLPEMIDAYGELRRLGVAFSVEAWEGPPEEGLLAGGMYGLALGRIVFGESMFHVRPGASKAAMAALIVAMKERGMTLLDCQQSTPHMLRLGAREIPRVEFTALVRQGVGLAAAPLSAEGAA